MEMKHKVVLGVAIGGVVAAYFLYDALTVSEAERLEAFVEDTTGEVSTARINAALTQYVDLDRQPLEVLGFGAETYFETANAEELPAMAHRALGPFRGQTLRTLARSVSVDGDVGNISLRLLSEAGMVEVAYRLRKREDRWLVSRVQVTR